MINPVKSFLTHGPLIFKMKLKLTQYKSLINIVTNNISQQTWTIWRNSNCSKAGNGMQNSKVLRDGLRIQKKK